MGEDSQPFNKNKQGSKNLNTTSEFMATSPSCTPENMIKAKFRFDTIQVLLKKKNSSLTAENNIKLQEQLASVFEEIIFSQSNNYDSQSLRLLMDF